MSEQVRVSGDRVLIDGLRCVDQAVVEFVRDVPESERPDAVRRAVSLGVVGLRSVQAGAGVDQVERGFDRLKAELERAFDPNRKGSYLDQFAGAVDDYLGEGGTVADAVARSGEQVVKILVEQIAQLRDAVVGTIATAAEREKGTAKGVDFEADVEAVLCRIARSYGDCVTNVATEAGEAGRSKKGDLVVTLAEGPRFVIEAKSMTTPLTLRGRNGILACLDEAMENRSAGFAIAVSKCEDALPREVGAFNAYDENKVVCAFGDDGQILEIAYRWARSFLRLDQPRADEGGVDADAIRASLVDAGNAVAELSKIKAKASVIAKTANEIQSIVEWHVARANQALSCAERALEADAEPEARAS